MSTIARKAVLTVADNDKLRNLMETNPKAQDLVRRFVAGDTVEDGIRVAKDFETSGITTTMDLLGENVNSEAEATAAVINYADVLKQMKANDLDPNVSVKLTMLGMDLSDDMARDNIARIVDVARDVDGFVRIDMEGSDYTERTMKIFREMHETYGKHVGIVLQTMLHRTAEDVVEMIDRGARVRLVKGAYAEPESVAIQSSKERDENFRMLMRLLLNKGTYPAIATHDSTMIEDAIDYARKNQIAPDRYEFQMLYGVRVSEQTRLKKKGYNMRVYVPFGNEWYAYYTRRIAEKPSNALFVLRQLIDR